MTYARSRREGGAIVPRSTPPPRSGRKTFARFVGAAGLVALTALLYWMLTDEAFAVGQERVRFDGLAHADEAAVRELLADIERGPNVFRVRASEIVSQLSTLTEVDAASARVTLPADVTVMLDERDPVFIWSDGGVSWLVDEEGMLFAPADVSAEDATASDGDGEGGTNDGAGSGADDGERDGTNDGDGEPAEEPAPDGSPRGRLPTVEDARLLEEPPTVGSYLSPIDLAVMRHLLAIDRQLLGSRARDLKLRVDDGDGYVLKSVDFGWRALFGHYTVTVQSPDVIPAQVQCLRWLLAAEERRLEVVRLAVSDDGCGTYTRLGG